jgi:hypothetical protein
LRHAISFDEDLLLFTDSNTKLPNLFLWKKISFIFLSIKSFIL